VHCIAHSWLSQGTILVSGFHLGGGGFILCSGALGGVFTWVPLGVDALFGASGFVHQGSNPFIYNKAKIFLILFFGRKFLFVYL